MLKLRTIRMIGAGALMAAGVLGGVRLAAAAAPAYAYCYSYVGTTDYVFRGGVDIENTPHEWQVTRVRGLFRGDDPENPSAIPSDGQNNFYSEVRDYSTGQFISNYYSPDSIRFEDANPTTNEEYSAGWFVPIAHRRVVQVRFSADFDRRNYQPDPRCKATTGPLTLDDPDAPDTPDYCARFPQVCTIIP